MTTTKGKNTCHEGEEVRAPEPYFAVFVFIGLIIGALYWKTVATERVGLDIEEGRSTLDNVCQHLGVGGGCGEISPTAAPFQDIMVYVTLIGSGNSTNLATVPPQIGSTVRKSALSQVEESFSDIPAIDREHSFKYLTRVRDAFDSGAKANKLFNTFQEKSSAEAAASLKPHELQSRASKIVSTVAKVVPEPLNSLATQRTTVLKVYVVYTTGVSATPQAYCSLDSDDTRRGGCFVSAPADLNPEGIKTLASKIGSGVGSVIARQLGVQDFKRRSLEAWGMKQRLTACCSARRSLATLEHLLQSVSGMPLPPSTLDHWTQFQQLVLQGNLVDASLLAHKLVNAPDLMPQLVLPWDQQLALHLPVFLPLSFSLLSGLGIIMKRRRAAKKAKAAEKAKEAAEAKKEE